MKPAHGADPMRQRLIVLNKPCREIQISPGSLPIDFSEPTTLIAMTLRSKEKQRHNNTFGLILFNVLKYTQNASLTRLLGIAIPLEIALEWVDERASMGLSTQNDLKALLELELLNQVR